ncbi:hypothetical protein J6P92_05340 [bacterium]|nr:hypothetical protein [bacterium]
MKNILLLIIVCTIFTIYNKVSAIPNPWIECGDDISCAADKAGFNFPLRAEKYSVRAMEDMIEITFPIDGKRTVTVRKSQLYNGQADENGIKDISGDYNKYPVNKTLKFDNGIEFKVRGTENKFYVVSFAAETGYYSFSCKKGLTVKDIKYLYKLLEEAEAPRHNIDEINNYTIEQLQDLRSVDGIVEPVYTQDCFPKTLQKKGVTKECFERANLGQDAFCSASEVQMIKEYYRKGQDKDPLNNGSGQFCAN